jgi:predicted transposase YdaD
MAEIATLPIEYPYRKSLLNLLVSYRMELAAKQNAEPEEQELVMQLSPLYLEQLEAARLDGERQGKQIGEQLGEQIGELKGRQDLVLRQLNRQVREIPVEVKRQVRSFSIEQLGSLGEALLDFQSTGDLLAWLQKNG